MRRELVLFTGLVLSLSSDALVPHNSQNRRRCSILLKTPAGVSNRLSNHKYSSRRRISSSTLSEANSNSPEDSSTSSTTTTPTSQKLQELQALETELENYLAYISMPSDDSLENRLTPVPRPPSIPPPLAKLFSASSSNDSQDKDPEMILQALRQSVQQEEERIRQAQDELRELQQQEETLRKAEATLQKSRQLAAQRRQKLLLQTQRATQSLESTRQQVEELSKAEAEEEQIAAVEDNEATSRSRSTVSLDDLASSSSNAMPSFMKSKSFLDAISSPKASASSSKRTTLNNIPTLSDWVQYDDGSISGTIQGSAHFEDGKTISTSPLVSTSVVQGGRVVETTSGTRYYLEESSVSSNPAPPSLDPPSQQETVATASRTTVHLESILSSDPNPSQPDDSSTRQPQEEEKQQEIADFDASRLETWDRYISQGIPVLYDWSFSSDTKSLSGKIRGSRNFPDDAIVGTSALTTSFPFAGTIVATESGSRYYLDLAATDNNGKANENTAEEQLLPEIRSWTQRDDGSISGQVYHSQTGAANGDFIVTSPIANQGDVTEGGIVETASGSRYYLSGGPSELPEEETLASSSSPPPASPTITIPKVFQTTTTSPTTTATTPRKTFSLSDLGFGFFGRGNLSKKLYDMEQRAPEGVPTLLDWTLNPQDQTLTGTVAGSSTMTDGSRITTSTIVIAGTNDGGVQQYQVIETTSGSKYFLG